MKPTNKTLARKWGCSSQYISQLRRQGMPMGSEDAALTWRVAHAKEGCGHKSGKRPVPKAVLTAARRQLTVATNRADDTPESVVQRARSASRSIHELLIVATTQAQAGNAGAAASLPSLVRIHGKAVANHIEAETRWNKHRVSCGELAPISELEERLDHTLEPIAKQLRNLPRNVAAAANPAAPDAAERAIEQAIRAVLWPISATLTAAAA